MSLDENSYDRYISLFSGNIVILLPLSGRYVFMLCSFSVSVCFSGFVITLNSNDQMFLCGWGLTK